ncbi:MAG: transcription antitermination factor NusB [Lachnospiraceae bacterium]|nr:transcription antitermination factor NusB [Lachnospiraceae bacterium]
MSTKKLSRRSLRENIFILVFMSEFNDYSLMPEQIRKFLDDPEREADEASLEYIEKKAKEIILREEELDDVINTYAEKWNTERMGRVELAIFRVAVFEMLYDDDIPVSVAINEAVELAKKYGPEDSPSFINGILANIVREKKL